MTELLAPRLFPIAAGFSLLCIALFILWPIFGGQNSASRRVDVALNGSERAARARRAEAVRGGFSLRAAVARWLSKAAVPSERLSRSMQLAGIRGPNAVLTYAVSKLALAGAFGAAVYLYVTYLSTSELSELRKLLFIIGGTVVGYALPSVLLKNRIVKRQQAIQRAWPNALDLMLICVESGMGIDQAMRKVAEEIGLESVDLAEEMTLTVAELSYLPDRRQAFENLSNRTGLETVRAVVASLKQAERHGTSLGTSLRVLSQENRDLRLSEAEKKAAALPPKLTVPMILFFLPVLFAVIIAPAAMQIMSVK